MEQQLVLEAHADAFIKIEKYKNAVSRPNTDEMRALDMKMIEKGQLEPIKVNRKMWVLDGYSRMELLEARGIPIKYEFRDFQTEEAEFEYVVETNVMRRQMNDYQRIETLYNMYKTQKETNIDLFKKSYFDVLTSIKNGNTDNEYISKDIGRIDSKPVLQKLTEDYYVSRKTEDIRVGKMGNTKYVYSLMPKAEDFLSKPLQKHTTAIMVGKITGVNRGRATKIIHMINNAPEEIKEKLREDRIHINEAYKLLSGSITPKPKNKRFSYWGARTEIQCPSCNHIASKDKYLVVNPSKETKNIPKNGRWGKYTE